MANSSIKIKESTYFPAGDAGKIFGYTSDYVARLAREGKILGERIGKQWFVSPDSLKTFIDESSKKKLRRSEKIRAERLKERVVFEKKKVEKVLFSPFPENPLTLDVFALRIKAIAVSFCIVLSGITVGILSQSEQSKNLVYHQMPSIQEMPQVMVGMAVQSYALVHNVAQTIQAHAEGERSFSFRAFAINFYHSIQGLTGTFVQNTPHYPNDVSNVRDNLVVLPGDATATDIESVRRSFSDEVVVEPDPSGDTGLIKPVFRSRVGNEFRYVLVPIDETQ